MATIEQALIIAARAHEGQTDKAGLPYILHPLRVMHAVHGGSQIVAVLHDVLEDTEVTAADLLAAGFGGEVLAALACLTRGRLESYADHVVRCKSDPVARQVKLADLEDNSRLDRLLLRAARMVSDVARLRKYALSYQFLTDKITERDYRRMLEGP